MAKWRRQRSGQSGWGRNPFVQKSTEELLQMKADLEARLIPIEAELADLAVRQAAAEPVVQRLASQLAEKRQAAQQLRCDPKSYVLGGLLGLGHKATVKEQLQLLYQECRQLEAELAKASQGGSLGNVNLLFTLPPRRLDYIWHEQRKNVARERKKWQIDRDLAFEG